MKLIRNDHGMLLKKMVQGESGKANVNFPLQPLLLEKVATLVKSTAASRAGAGLNRARRVSASISAGVLRVHIRPNETELSRRAGPSFDLLSTIISQPSTFLV
jgi:hypothetical protein